MISLAETAQRVYFTAGEEGKREREFVLGRIDRSYTLSAHIREVLMNDAPDATRNCMKNNAFESTNTQGEKKKDSNDSFEPELNGWNGMMHVHCVRSDLVYSFSSEFRATRNGRDDAHSMKSIFLKSSLYKRDVVNARMLLQLHLYPLTAT